MENEEIYTIGDLVRIRNYLTPAEYYPKHKEAGWVLSSILYPIIDIREQGSLRAMNGFGTYILILNEGRLEWYEKSDLVKDIGTK